ncbi:CubicO group peptidase (beta-lactamase class C family) [Nocardiopsis sp. Huas11]|uniref:serine hydrolase domain-containing protein n=1 Tax=Nocardiopsis sp. Huas11 TaxID=2183912 RepID=UPI000EAD0D3C|nr:serine hydrolase domain-containing protein [Nocardiopsis sp. Huas11]RKS06407.1 CubicO group peptidase (beta-lactamase class C family) [Nocardiopsis sp. Huas11]
MIPPSPARRRAHLLLCLLAALGLSFAHAVPASAATASTPAPAVVDAVVEEYREATGLPGAAVVLTHGSEVVHARGYGTTPAGDPVTEHTPMAVASLSKSITALAVLQLAEDGELDLDDAVREHLPEFTMADSRADRITVRQLLDQTSGMSDTEFASYSRGRSTLTLRQAVADLRSARLAAEPGTRWEYHNPNAQVAARLVEVVGGRSFADHLRARVFSPLGMDDSTTIDTDLDLPPSAHGHVRVLGHAFPADEPPGFGNGSGGVISTAADLGAWLVAHDNGGRGPDGTRVLSEEGVRALHTPSEVSGSYALGWSLGETASGAPVVEHGGDLLTATAHQALLPDSGHGVAVLANTGSAGGAYSLAAALVELIDSGSAPSPPTGTAPLAVDAVLLALGAAAVPLAWRGVRRARGWALARAGRPWWDVSARLLPYAVPSLLMAGLHEVVGWLFRGRDVAWFQVPYLFTSFWIALLAVALACVAVGAARLVHLVAGRRRSRPARSAT